MRATLGHLFVHGLPPKLQRGWLPSAPLQFQKISAESSYRMFVVGTTLSKHFRSPFAAGLPYSQPRIKAAWRVVHSGQEEFEKAGAIDPEHLEVMQLDVAMHLAKVEDGHAILYTEWSTRRSLRYIEQAATNLISMSTPAPAGVNTARRFA